MTTHKSAEEAFAQLGYGELRPPTPIGRYRYGVRAGELLFVSGTYGTVKDAEGRDVLPIRGKLGRELSVADGRRSARLVAANLLAMVRAEVGDLNKVSRMVRLAGYVNSVPDFAEAPAVVDGASELLFEVFGEDRGGHARIALYQPNLPRQAPLACELTVLLTASETAAPT
jgi:enamine deaminase RidA (YjgF/YER057c/UK114 family)